MPTTIDGITFADDALACVVHAGFLPPAPGGADPRGRPLALYTPQGSDVAWFGDVTPDPTDAPPYSWRSKWRCDPPVLLGSIASGTLVIAQVDHFNWRAVTVP